MTAGPMIASLPMYDLEPARGAQDAWWAGLARHLRAAGIAGVPATLTRDVPRETVWHSPDLLLSQTCGYPLVHALAGRVRYVATPAYAAPGARGARYSSAIVVGADAAFDRVEALRGATCAVNACDSQSGWNALRAAVAPFAEGRRFFAAVRASGNHLASLAAVAAGEADACAVDCVTHALAARHCPRALSGTRVLGYTGSAPGLPYVTRADADDETLTRVRVALAHAGADPDLAAVRADLLIAGVEVLPEADYDAILAMEAQADRYLDAL